eukprot:Opistho-2@85337
MDVLWGVHCRALSAHLLCHHTEWMAATVDLIGSEWPRSRGARTASLCTSAQHPLPASIILVSPQHTSPPHCACDRHAVDSRGDVDAGTACAHRTPRDRVCVERAQCWSAGLSPNGITCPSPGNACGVGCDVAVVAHARIVAVEGDPEAVVCECVVVAPSFRSGGVGTAMMAMAEDYIRRLHMSRIYVGIESAHVAPFYRKLGFCESTMDVRPVRSRSAVSSAVLKCFGRPSHANESHTLPTAPQAPPDARDHTIVSATPHGNHDGIAAATPTGPLPDLRDSSAVPPPAPVPPPPLPPGTPHTNSAANTHSAHAGAVGRRKVSYMVLHLRHQPLPVSVGDDNSII